MRVKQMILSLVACASGVLCLSLPASAQTSPSPYTSATRYDVLNRATGTIAADPDGAGPLKFAATRTTYDSAGRPTKVESGELASWQPETVAPQDWPSATASPAMGFAVLSSIETSFDALNRKTKEVTTGSDGVIVSVVQYSYDATGRLECTAQRMNPAIYGSLPASACSLGTEGSFGPDRIVKNVYDTAGRLWKVQKAVGTALQEDYATYTYSLNGKRTSLTDARGYMASMTYDGHDRQARWYFPSPATTGVASTTDYEEYGYDADGNRTSLRKRDGSVITYQYDALNRNTVKIVPERSGLAATHTRDIYYGYDLRGLQTYARFDSTSGEGLAFTYDGFGRPIDSTVVMDGTSRALSYWHDKNGNRTQLSWPDLAKSSYDYDGLDRMSVLYEGAIGLNVNLVSYGYNSRGLRDRQNGRYSQYTMFSYDPVGRSNGLGHDFPGATNDVAFTYGYTPASQMAQQSRDNDAYAWNGHYNVDRSYTANGLNQYTAAGAASFTYDANGNLTSDGSTTYVYDVENRLVSASGAKNATLRYDPLGRLYETVGGGATTRFLHDGDELIAEYDGAGTLLRRYVHGKNVDDPVVWYEGSSLASPRWLHTDHQGSVVTVTDSSGGAAVAINSYDEYGIPKTGNLGRFQYTGQAWLPEIGMYYYKARIYSPTLGRFLQTDPIGYDDQVNLYAYVGSDPIIGRDPTGMLQQNNLGDYVKDWVNSIGESISDNVSRIESDLRELPGHIANGTTGLPPVTGVGAGSSLIGSVTPLFKLESAAGKMATEAAMAARAEAQAGGATKGAVSGLVTKSKTIFTGASKRAGGPGGPTNSAVKSALGSIPDARRSGVHGCCGEVNALSKALDAGADVTGATVRTIGVKSGELKAACPSCTIMLNMFGLKY